MKNRVILIWAWAGMLSIGMAGATPVWLAGRSSNSITPGANPFEIHVISQDASGTTVEVLFSGLMLESTDAGLYRVRGDGNHQIQPSNMPRLPRWSTWIDLGRDDAGQVTIIEQDRQVVSGYPLEKIHSAGELSQNQWFPAEQVTLGPPEVLRDIRMASLTVFPVLAGIQSGELDITSRIVIRIDRHPGQGANPKTTPDRPIPYAYAHLYNQMLLTPLDDSRTVSGDHLLIITPDTWVDELEPMIRWKFQKGVKVSVTRFSEIGANPGNPTSVRDHIVDVYNNWTDVPDFVLFVGDETQFPIHYTYTPDPPTMFSYYSYPGNIIDDNWFVCVDGNDYFPEFFQGRWVVNNATEVDLLVTKLLIHERDLFMQDSTWYTEAVMAADYDETSMRETKSYVKSLLFQNGFTRIDSVFYGGAGMLSSYINDGRNYVNYRGSGWYYGWAGIPYYVENVEALTNYYTMPIVTGIGCGVAKYDVAENQCFGERWMTVGTANSPRGAAGFIGPTWNTHTNYNDELDKGIYHALLDSLDLELSPILVSGKMFAYNQFQPYFNQDPNIIEVVRSLFNQYVNISDPELDLFTSRPWRPQIEHPIYAIMGTTPMDITVTNSAGEGVAGVRVCAFVDTSSFAVGETDSQGEVTLQVTVLSVEDSVLLTVSSANVFPTQVTIPVSPSGVLVLHDSTAIRDHAQGNGDGLLNPGEQVDLHEIVVNIGNAVAVDVHAQLATEEPTVNITQDQAGYGNIAPDDTAGSNPDYALTLSQECDIGNVLEFSLSIIDTGSIAWDQTVSIPVATPNLDIIGVTVIDGGNGRWDVGETVDLGVTIANIGLQSLPETQIYFRCSDPHVIIHDSVATLPASDPGDTVETGADNFRVESAGNTLPESILGFSIYATHQFQTYTYSQNSPTGIMIGLITPESPAYDDSLYYFAYDSWDSSYTECPSFEWDEIAPAQGGPGEALPFNHTDQTIPVELPFDFQYYGQTYDHVSVSTDGWLAMGSTTITNYTNSSIPAMDGIAAMIAPFWDDLWHYSNEQGQIATYYDAEQNFYVVEYSRVGHYGNAGQQETFEVVLFDPAVYETITGDGEFMFVYNHLTANGISYSTTGMEDPSQRIGIQYNYNGEYPPSCTGLFNGLLIKFTTDPPEIITDVPRPIQNQPVPKEYVLDQNYPNPFNPSTTIRFGLPQPGPVTLTLFNILGQKVVTLVDASPEAGYHQIIWNGRDRNGIDCAAGVYFYQLRTQGNTLTKKMVLLK
jgi:hypothetical protein